MDTNKKATILGIVTALAMPLEGLRQYAYYDPPGILTVCYGTTTNVIKGKKYTLDECKASLNSDMLKAIETVDVCTKGLNLSINQYVAFSDMVYNLGPTPICNTSASTLARKLKANDITGACNQIPLWNKAKIGGVLVPLPGLTKRRNIEKDLCLS